METTRALLPLAFNNDASFEAHLRAVLKNPAAIHDLRVDINNVIAAASDLNGAEI